MRTASRQSAMTIRWLADRRFRADAYALYAYFRWLDDEVDERLPDAAARLALVERQRRLLAAAVEPHPAAGAGVGALGDLHPRERLLVDLLRDARGPRTDRAAIRESLTAMVDVMAFDAARRGARSTAAELAAGTERLAVAVTEAMHACIGHGEASPPAELRYVAVRGAHVAHLLRDLVADLDAGYVNVPLEVVGADRDVRAALDAGELTDWVHERVELARACFATGREALRRVENPRCRLAGHAYIARFEWVLDAIERDGYRLRASYEERRRPRAGLAIMVAGLRSAAGHERRDQAHDRPAAPVRREGEQR